MKRTNVEQISRSLSKSNLQKHKNSNIINLNSALIISAHQPTLLPYPGFFYRMYHSKIMDLCPYDPLSRHNDRYQHRVKIGLDDNWKWLTLPIKVSNNCAIKDAKIKTEFIDNRWTQLEQVYQSYPLWDYYKDKIKEIFFGYNYLWEINLHFVLLVRDILGIKTYISLSYSGEGSDTTERIASQFRNYGTVIYLAGRGSMTYLDIQKYQRLTRSKVAIITYIPPYPFSTVSILSPLLMFGPDKTLDILKIKREPIKVIINGIEHQWYLNSSKK